MAEMSFWYDGFMDADDLAALKCLMENKQAKLVGVSRSFGQKEADSRTEIAIEKLADTKIIAGAQRPIIARNSVSYAQKEGDSRSLMAWDAMADVAEKEGKLTLLCAGTLTNAAIALLRYNDMVRYLERIVFIAGTLGVGNHGAMSDRKSALDVYSLKTVLMSHIPLLYIAVEFWDTRTAAPVDLVRCAMDPELETRQATMDVETVLCDQFARVTLDTRVRNKAEKNVEFVYVQQDKEISF